jgi:hypothetical protein
VLYSTFSALIGTQSVLFSKTLAVLVRATANGDNQVRRTWADQRGGQGHLAAAAPSSQPSNGPPTRGFNPSGCHCAPSLPTAQFKGWFIYLMIPCFLFAAVFWITRLNKARGLGAKGNGDGRSGRAAAAGRKCGPSVLLC